MNSLHVVVRLRSGGLVTDRVPEVGKGPDNPIVAPGAMLLRQTHDQRLQLWIDGRTPWRLALRGAIKLLGHKFAVPAKDRLGFDDRGYFLQSLLAQPVTNLREGLPFGIRQPDTHFDLVAQDAIFRHQVLVAEQQFLIDGPRDIGQ